MAAMMNWLKIAMYNMAQLMFAIMEASSPSRSKPTVMPVMAARSYRIWGHTKNKKFPLIFFFEVISKREARPISANKSALMWIENEHMENAKELKVNAEFAERVSI